MSARTLGVFVDIDGVINALPDKGKGYETWEADTWRTGSVYMEEFHEEVALSWSTEVVERLLAIEAMPGTEMVWCTTWEHRAAEQFAPVVGLGADWRHVGPRRLMKDGRYDWWKANRVWEAREQYDRVLWMDDDIASWTNILTMHGWDDSDWLWIADERTCGITPQSRRGLDLEDFENINDWLTS
jgi:hypothetical protein